MKKNLALTIISLLWSFSCLLSAQDISDGNRMGVWHGKSIQYQPSSFMVQKHEASDYDLTRKHIATLFNDVKSVEYIAYDWFLVTLRQEIGLEYVAEYAQRYKDEFRHIEPTIVLPMSLTPNDPLFPGSYSRFDVGQWYH